MPRPDTSRRQFVLYAPANMRDDDACAGVMHMSLRRRDCAAHPLLLSGLVVSLGAARLTRGGVQRALVRLANELKARVCHARWVREATRVLARYTPLRLHVGCGTRVIPGWCNIDLGPDADLHVDVRRPLPIRDGSCAEIYSEHFIEHLAYPGEIEHVLRDWHRVLVPGGRVSVGVPDVGPPLVDYAAVRDRFVPDYTDGDAPAWVETALDKINYIFRQQGFVFGQEHLYAYDFATLVARLTSAGFIDIRQRAFDFARDARPGSLYVDARKP